ncbi:peptidoglycan DD-metalloendopeptidase family protein [Cellulomonas sp. 179-A 4D5 NHS]|uniref:peptidoglycan DD-metalloendopeptidase family protein n=1 Tax=Cellulomonas sp. 179-A 4D5 NHS TaxID=3142378 RepID=UPI0039A09582
MLAASLAGLLAAGLALAPPAAGDPITDQRRDAEQRAAAAERRAEELQASIEGLSAELSQAVLDLQATQARLPVAQAELAAAQETLERTQREAALIAARLQDAQDQQNAITETIAADDARGQEIRASIGQLARRAYKGGQGAMPELDLVMESETTEDFVDQSARLATALRTQTRTLEELREIEAANRNSQVRLTAVKDRITELKIEAEQKVVEADAARAAAQARQAEIERLIADQTARQQAIAGMKAQAEAEQAQIDAQRNAIAAELADIIARERAAAEAARAAAAAAAAAAGKKPPPAVPAPSGSVSGSMFSNPTSIDPMYVTSEYGMRLHPILGYTRLHAGIDLRTYCNTPLYAPRDGRVRWAEWRNGFGNQVMIDYGTVDGNSLMTSSNHLTRAVVGAGQQVSRGQLIGYSGNTGLSGACHLHFEVYVNGSTVNPRPLLGR